ncbi:DUF1800 domain-containing protein [Rhodoflexus caldus]|uniref:DUF1800 domain-containing protein n=1 Tax=Rhodoflexus caldus TaxID=2891236 RepID=UPI00202A8122|nr:DUF1800 domain-containing protein [Rhodoflexus caldus]
MPPVWNVANAKHLLARTLFGYTRRDLEQALSTSLTNFVNNQLLANLPAPAPPGAWIREAPVANNGTVDRQRLQEMRLWWLGLMARQGLNIQEKMVLFWHNHFVSESSKVQYPQYLYEQNRLTRQYALGDFREFTKAMTIDPAMLIYLDGRTNTRSSPNENYARELLELFTIGIGHYTEADIREAAKALTGWTVNGLNAVFTQSRFNTETKTFLGRRGNFGYREIVDIIFEQAETARFICRKLYKEFVYYQPDEAFVEQMADVFRRNNYQIRPVLAFLFTSDHFYEPRFKGVKIKSPVELAIGVIKQLELTVNDFSYLNEMTRSLQQELFEPPDVRGWEGQRKWITSTTYPNRNVFTDTLINGRRTNGQTLPFRLNALTYARSYRNAENAALFVREVTDFCLDYPLTDSRRASLLETLLSGTIAANWSTSLAMADTRILSFLRAMMRLPEYQLC